MKPIFNEEKQFLEGQLGIELPTSCWRDGSSIYLNSDTKPAIVKFKVENGKLVLKQNKIAEVLEHNKNKKWLDEIQKNINRLVKLERISIEKTKEFIESHPNHKIRVGMSGGKDSDVMFYILYNFIFKPLNIDDYVIDFNNTTNDTAQTYLQVKENLPAKKLIIHNPEKGWYNWLKEDKNYFIPSVTVRNCCSTYKEGQLKKDIDKNEDFIMFVGMRKYESTKRSKYDFDLNEAIKKQGIKNNMSDKWLRFLPIVEWTDVDIWLYIMWRKIKVNQMYSWGFNRCGCLICPFQNDYIDLLTKKYYPMQWKRWEKVLVKNYELYDVENRLKWTLEEWINGQWKQGTSKEQYIIQNKPTKERIKELAEIKGISEELAEKYFQRKCSCGKKLNPDEVALNLKMYGRSMNVDKMQCKKCFCEANNLTGKEYQEKVHEFRNSGCSLF